MSKEARDMKDNGSGPDNVPMSPPNCSLKSSSSGLHHPVERAGEKEEEKENKDKGNHIFILVVRSNKRTPETQELGMLQNTQWQQLRQLLKRLLED